MKSGNNHQLKRLPSYVAVGLMTAVFLLMMLVMVLWIRIMTSELGPHVIVAEPIGVRYVGEFDNSNQNNHEAEAKPNSVVASHANLTASKKEKKCGGVSSQEFTFAVKEVVFGRFDKKQVMLEAPLFDNCKPHSDIDLGSGSRYLVVFDRPSARGFRLRNSAPIFTMCNEPNDYAVVGDTAIVTLKAIGLAETDICICDSHLNHKECEKFVKGVRLSLLKKHLKTLAALRPQHYLNNVFQIAWNSEDHFDPENARCRNWRVAGSSERADILSWMKGFLDAKTLDMPKRSQKSYSYTDLAKKLDEYCQISTKKRLEEKESKSMKEVLLELPEIGDV